MLSFFVLAPAAEGSAVMITALLH